MNILVTGANGQLGNEIKLAAVDAADNYFFTGSSELDITNKEAIRDFAKQNLINIIVNCAAYTNVDKAEDDCITANLINNIAVGYLADVCKEIDATLIHISTDYVFGGDSNIPYSELDTTKPLGVYGDTKLNGERQIIRSCCKNIIIRTSWLYSSFGNNFVKTMQRLTRERESLNVVFDQVGSPTYAADLASFICNIISNRLYDNNNGTYHYSNEGVCSWYDFAIEIAKQMGNDCNINPCHSSEFPSRVERPHFSVLDKTKIKAVFGVKIPYWRDSLAVCVTHLK